MHLDANVRSSETPCQFGQVFVHPVISPHGRSLELTFRVDPTVKGFGVSSPNSGGNGRVLWAEVESGNRMARKAETFRERLQAAKDIVALYNHTQEVRAVLAVVPDFPVDASGMRDGLCDAARHLFQEIFLWSKPERAEDYGAIFDIIDIELSEPPQALRAVADPVATANDRLLKLIAHLDVETIASGYEDLVFHLREEVVQFVNPNTVDQVRGFPKSLQGLGLVHLLDQYKACPGTSPMRIREAESWIGTFLDRDANEIAEVMANLNIHTARDLLDWGRNQ